MTGDALEDIEPFLQPLLDSLRPGERRRMIDKLMRMARRHQADRIRRNVEPEGGTMTPRKPREGKRGKMFRNIGKARNLKIRAHPDRGELTFGGGLIEHTAAVHHFGLKGYVGRTRNGRKITTRYESRRLLGHGKEREEYLDEVLEQLANA